MGIPYSAFRRDNPGAPTTYAPHKTAVSVDVTFAGIIFAFAILSVSFLAILPGIRKPNRLYAAVRFFVSMFIGATILLSLYGQGWEVSSLSNVTTAYKAHIKDEIQANIGVRIGLNNVNITLKGLPEKGQLNGERINYNERFGFCCGQGRLGFSTFAGRINQEFRAAQWKGLPYPILWIAEYFTLDGEGLRWGRSYRTAGLYAFYALWAAFPLWILALITSFFVVRDCGLLMFMVGFCQLTANVLYSTIRYSSMDLAIPFNGEQVLVFSKGGAYYLCMVGGIVSVVVGVAIVIFDDLYPFKTARFFNVDPLQDFEDGFVMDAGSCGSGDGRMGVKSGEAGSAKRPLSAVNEDPRAEKFLAEIQSADEHASGEYSKGDMYLNLAESTQTYSSKKKTIFRKNKPRRKPQNPSSATTVGVNDLYDYPKNTSSLQRLTTESQLKFSINKMDVGSCAEVIEDSVAMDPLDAGSYGCAEIIEDHVAMETSLDVEAISGIQLGCDNEINLSDE